MIDIVRLEYEWLMHMQPMLESLCRLRPTCESTNERMRMSHLVPSYSFGLFFINDHCDRRWWRKATSNLMATLFAPHSTDFSTCSFRVLTNLMSYGASRSALQNSTMRRSEHQAIGVRATEEKQRRYVILPAATNTVVAESFDIINKDRFVRSNVESDLVVQVGDSSFHLHKVPVVSKSEYISRRVFGQRVKGEKAGKCLVRIENQPGGAEIFEQVAMFCYGWRVDTTPSNVAPLHCAANILQMGEDLEAGNLLSKTEAFLSFLILSSWKDTFRVLKSCEAISPWAKEFLLVRRCTEAIAWKCSITHREEENYFDEERTNSPPQNWWLEDLSGLRIDHFIEVVESLKKKGVGAEYVGQCIAYWATRWFIRLPSGLDSRAPRSLDLRFQRLTLDCLIRMLPSDKHSVSCNFILHLYNLSHATKIHSELLEVLEKRMVSSLNLCALSDLLVNNCQETKAMYDVRLVTQVVKFYVSCETRNAEQSQLAVAKLVDEYLSYIARDRNLTIGEFRLLSEALPKNARSCDDNLYGAIDMFLKTHPNLTEEERISISSAMDVQKLSREGREHAMKNNRLPAEKVASSIFTEQVRLGKSASGRRWVNSVARTQRAMNCFQRESRGGLWKDIKKMKQELEKMKVQIHDLEKCRSNVKRMANS